MKSRLNPIFVSLIVIGSAAIAQADSYNWNGSTTGGATGLSNTWDTSTANWTGFGTTWPSVSTGNDDASFSGTAGTVTIDAGGVTANDLTFSTSGYALGGGQLTLVQQTLGSVGAVINTGSGVSASISSNIAGTLGTTGASGLNKSGSGTLTLSGTNSFTGWVTISGGSVKVTKAAAITNIGTGSNWVFVNNSTFELDGTSGNIALTNRFQTSGGVILNSAGVNSISSTLYMNSSTSNTLKSEAGSLNYTGSIGGGTGSRKLTLDGASILDNRVTGVIANSSVSTSLLKTGDGYWSLHGANTYSGTTTVDGGRLIIAQNQTGTGNVVINDGGTIKMSAAKTFASGINVAVNLGGTWYMDGTSQQVGQLTGEGTIDETYIHTGTDTLTVGSGNATSQFDGIIAGGTGVSPGKQAIALTKTGSGDFTLTNSNAYVGTTTVTGGTLILGNATDTIADTSPVNVNGGTLDIGGNADTIGALTVTSGSITGTTGILTAASCAGKAGTVSGILGSSTNLSGTDTTWLTKDTAGTLELSAANTFTGNITVTAGRLTLSNSQALGVADPAPGGTNRKGIIMQGTGRALWLKGGITIPANIDFFMSSSSADTGGINNESGNNEIQSPINFSVGNGALNIASSAGTLTISGNITQTANGRTLHLGGGSLNDNTISGDISENSAASILPVVKQGAGKWILSGINTYKGDTDVRVGTLVLANGGSLSFYPKADASCNKITDSNLPTPEPIPVEGVITLDGAFNIDLTATAAAPDSTSWLLVDVDNVDETFDNNFTVTGFTESPLGTWKKTVSPSVYTFTESDGRLVKTAAPSGSPFSNWMSTNFPAITSPNNDPEDDPDGDGVNNLAEFAFSGNPGDGSNNGLLRFGVEDVSGTDHLTYTFACRSGATFTGAGPTNASRDGVDYSVRASLDLSAFTVPVSEASPAITTGLPAAPSGYTYRTFRVNDPQSANPKSFIQVKTSPTAP